MSVVRVLLERTLGPKDSFFLLPKLLLVTSLAVVLAGSAHAQSSVSLAWSASTDPTVTGYRMYQGGASQAYTNVVDVGNGTTVQVTNLIAGGAYYFAVTAYDAAGLESPFSNEITYNVPVPPVPVSVISLPVTAATVTAPFTVNGTTVSQSVQTGVTNGGRAAYSFTITNAGTYMVSALVSAPTDAANSFYVNIDAEPTDPVMIWDIQPPTSALTLRPVTWRGNGTDTSAQYVPAVFNLSAGSHQLVVRGREANTQLGTITILPYLHLSNPLSLLGGSRSIRGLGVANAHYVLWAATNLMTPVWTAVSTNTSDAQGSFTCTDPAATNFTRRFYRVQMQ